MSPDVELFQGESEREIKSYVSMRIQLEQIGYTVLPHPILGFCDNENDLPKALKALERVKYRVETTLR